MKQRPGISSCRCFLIEITEESEDALWSKFLSENKFYLMNVILIVEFFMI